MNRLIIFLLFAAGFAFTLYTTSLIFDGDFGWHLRFGKEATQGIFPYTDTYTWTHFGERWVNHEWGGDVLFWLVYSNFSYNALVVLVSLVIWLVFAAAPLLATTKRLSPATLLISILGIYAIDFLLAMRLTILAPLFFIILLWSLEKLPSKSYCYFWPPLFWLWSALHGSWILGFIVIVIYFISSLAQTLLSKPFPHFFSPYSWTKKTYCQVAIVSLASFLITAINPYGFGLWREVGHYFSNNFYKLHISEWLPSYVYPIYWLPLILATVSFVILFFAWRAKKVGLPQLLLFIAFFISGIQYRRNLIYLLLISLPILATTFEHVIQQFDLFKNREFFWKKYVQYGFKAATLACGLIISVYFISKIHWTKDVWSDKNLLWANGFPVGATQLLTQKTTKPILFNEFSWGGFFNWKLPDSLVYLDGRGTATWRFDMRESSYEHYRKIKFEYGGLAELEQTPTQYIILRRNFSGYIQPNWLNVATFSKEELQRLMAAPPSQLETDLAVSKKWELWYEDGVSELWRRK